MSTIDDLTARYRAVLEAIAATGADLGSASVLMGNGRVDIHVPSGGRVPEPQALAILAVLAPGAPVERRDYPEGDYPFSAHVAAGVAVYAELHPDITPED